MKTHPKFTFWLLLVPLIFFFVGFRTLGDYNVNWDEPLHFMRGQAYLRYIATGETTYERLPHFQEFQTYLSDRTKKPVVALPRLSLYQNSSLDAVYFLQNDYGHPPLNDILAAFTNQIFYQRLGWFGDIESYHLFIVVCSVILVFLVGLWALEEYGIIASIVASLSLALYPIFIAESHNNIKDPVESTFFTLALYTFYKSVKLKNWKWMMGSAIFSGIALGTKLNIAFLPFILIPWLGFIAWPWLKKRKFPQIFNSPRSFWISVLIYPIIPLLILYISWPRMWISPLPSFFAFLKYYKDIGTNAGVNQPGYIFHGINIYPTLWILYTTPIVTLFFFLLGVYKVVANSKREIFKPALLWLIWIVLTVLRVSLPHTAIYGGTRQIMEYTPAVALLAGLGASYIVSLLKLVWFKRSKTKRKLFLFIVYVLFLASFAPIAFKMISLHPNEGLYFNLFIGGLRGAAAHNFPSWGSILGNPYLQGIRWINKNAEKNSILTLNIGTRTNIPSSEIRNDIYFGNNMESLILHRGEYIMGLTYSDIPLPYDALYPDRYLIPIYQIDVEGVPILKIWKNDIAHTKPDHIREQTITNQIFVWGTREGGLVTTIDLTKPYYLTRLLVDISRTNCSVLPNGTIYTSLDGEKWNKEQDDLLVDQVPTIKKVEDGRIMYLFAAIPTRYIRVIFEKGNSCFTERDYKVVVLRDLQIQ